MVVLPYYTSSLKTLPYVLPIVQVRTCALRVVPMFVMDAGFKMIGIDLEVLTVAAEFPFM